MTGTGRRKSIVPVAAAAVRAIGLSFHRRLGFNRFGSADGVAPGDGNSHGDGPAMTIKEFQDFIDAKYGKRDRERGTPHTFLWFMEEIGELASALAGDNQVDKEEEFADVLAWLCTLANINDVDLTHALEKYTIKGVDGFK